jgi:hypothetical protein
MAHRFFGRRDILPVGFGIILALFIGLPTRAAATSAASTATQYCPDSGCYSGAFCVFEAGMECGFAGNQCYTKICTEGSGGTGQPPR